MLLLAWIGAIAADARELQSFPRIGRPGRVEGTREIAFSPLPYIAVYEILDAQDEVRVLRILHGAQQWPPRQA